MRPSPAPQGRYAVPPRGGAHAVRVFAHPRFAPLRTHFFGIFVGHAGCNPSAPMNHLPPSRSSLRTSLVLVSLTLATAALGCGNLEGGGGSVGNVGSDPANANGATVAHAPVHASLETIAPVIGVGVDKDHRAPYVVLDAEPDGDESAAEAPAEQWRDPVDTWTLLARKNLSTATAAKFASLEGTRVQLTTVDGARCEGVLGKPIVLGRVDAMDENTDPQNTVPSPDDADGSAWARVSGGRAIVAPLVGRSCELAVDAQPWSAATLANDPTPRIVGTDPAGGNDRMDVLATFRATEEWKEIASRRSTWDADMGIAPETKPWDERDAASSDVAVVTVAGKLYAWVSASTYGGCGDFDGTLTALFLEGDGGKGWTLESTWSTAYGIPTAGWETSRGVAWTFADGSVARPLEGKTTFVTAVKGFEGCPC